MNSKGMKLPLIIIAIGVLVAVLSCFLTGILKEPRINEHEFEYSVTYRFNGEVHTFEDVFKCRFVGYEEGGDPTLRIYEGVYEHGNSKSGYSSLTIAQEDGVELSLITSLDAAYMMGDPDKYEYVAENEEPYLEALDAEGCSVEVSDFFDAEIISWEYPEPIENSFKFVGFSSLYAISMAAMLIAGGLTIIACMIFVRKNKDVSYNVFDKLSATLNFIVGLAVIPFITIVVFMFPLTMDPETLIYQIYLCVPALTAFSIAASVALRRKGFTKSGLLVQFVFPVLFFAQVFVESLIYNLS